MAEEFVRQDVFDARMDRLEAIISQNLSELKNEIKATNERMDKNISELKTEIKATNERITQSEALINERMDKNIGELKTEIKATNERITQSEALINERMDKNIGELKTEIKATNERITQSTLLINERMERNQNEIKGEIRVLDAKIDSVQTTVYWTFGAITIIIGLVTFVPAIQEFFKTIFRRPPSFTMEDVKRAIDDALKAERAVNKA